MKLQSTMTALSLNDKDVSGSSFYYPSGPHKVQGFIIRPKAEGKYPLIIYNRGGFKSFGSIRPEYIERNLVPIAKHGYVVAASQYRGAGESEGKDEFGGADVEDLIALHKQVSEMPDIDASRLGMVGWSRGAVMTFRAMLRLPSLKAVVVGGAPTDLAAQAEERPDMHKVFLEAFGSTPEKYEQGVRERSVLHWVDKLPKVPMLIMHGTSDWRVPATHSLRLAEALYKLQYPYRLIHFEGGDHGIWEYKLQVERQMFGWLDRFVRDGEPLPNMQPHGK